MVTTTITPTGGMELGGSADVLVVHGGGYVEAEIVVEWDFDNDGDFDGEHEDVTALLRAGESKTGRDWASNLNGKTQPGELRLTFDNSDDRFSYFNAASPLNTAPNSLRTGRRIRVRTAESTPNDPLLLARDRFNRSDGTLGNTETGQTWVTQANSGFEVSGNRAISDAGAALADTVSTIDIGVTDCYVQAVLPTFPSNDHSVGLVARWEDSSNYVRVTRTAFEVRLSQIDGGVGTTLIDYDLSPWPDMTIGLGVVGDQATLYVGGVAVDTATTTLVAGELVGLYSMKASVEQAPPAIDEFHVWDHVAGQIEGIIWSGRVEEVRPDVALGPVKVVSVKAVGILAHAADVDVKSPRVPESGNATGFLVGEMMARAGLSHPPAPDGLDIGDAVTGPVAAADGNSLALARLGEEVETGFLHESNEGYPAFQSASARAGSTPQSWFTDDSSGQFHYSAIEPLDHHRDLVNRVTAGVAPSEPGPVSLSTDFADVALGGTNHVDVTMPSVNAGDLLVTIIRRAAQASNVSWLTPIWWTNHRSEELTALRTRVYSHHCDGTESGTNVRFYTDSGTSGGAWVSHTYRVENWYLATPGIAVGTFIGGRTPAPLDHRFGRVSALYIAVCSGTTGAGTGSIVGATYPDGYSNGNTSVFTTNGDVFLSTARKLDCVDAEAPTAFAGDDDFALVEAAVIAVRGYNGEHEVLPTIKNPSRFEATPGRFVTTDDVTSQEDHAAVRTHASAPNLFATEGDAENYGLAILANYSDDRPIISITWPATLSADYRSEAVNRRVGDMIWLQANDVTGLGVDGAFFVESIGHRWSAAGKQWWVTWDLSPA